MWRSEQWKEMEATMGRERRKELNMAMNRDQKELAMGESEDSSEGGLEGDSNRQEVRGQ